MTSDVLGSTLVVTAGGFLLAAVVMTNRAISRSSTVMRVAGVRRSSTPEAVQMAATVRIGFPWLSQQGRIWWSDDACYAKFWVPGYTEYFEFPRRAVDSVILRRRFGRTIVRLTSDGRTVHLAAFGVTEPVDEVRRCLVAHGWLVAEV